MPSGGGKAVIEEVLRTDPGVRFLALSVSDAAEDVIAVIRAGARGYVTKTIGPHELADAIRRVHDGDAVFSPRLAGFVLDAFAGEPATVTAPQDPELDKLTAREGEVLRLIARGYTYKEIARRLEISVKTVETHVSAVLRKLQLSTRHELDAVGQRPGRRVTSRPSRFARRRPEDVDAVAAIFAEPAVAPWWPRYDRDRIEREFVTDVDDDTTVYVIEVDGVVAGVIQSWEEPDEEYRHAGMDIAVSTAWHGKDVAIAALRGLARHLVEDLGPPSPHDRSGRDQHASHSLLREARLPPGRHPAPERDGRRRHVPRHAADGSRRRRPRLDGPTAVIRP